VGPDLAWLAFVAIAKDVLIGQCLKFPLVPPLPAQFRKIRRPFWRARRKVGFNALFPQVWPGPGL
jgi:hypothetical protein